MLRHAFRPVFRGRIHQYNRAGWSGDHLFSGWLAGAVALAPDLVFPENAGLCLFLHLDARDLAAPALRPVDASWLEGVDAAGTSEYSGHRMVADSEIVISGHRR